MPPLRLGVIVPSSNTTLEPLTQKMVADLATATGRVISVHFARFRVTTIALTADTAAQFAPDHILAAARLLVDAHVDVIGWSGTAASWLGFATDTALCAAIARETGVPATTSVLAMNARVAAGGAVGLVSPYTTDMDTAIRASYAGIGIDVPDGRACCAGLLTNQEFGAIDEVQLDRMVGAVAGGGAEAVLIMCTNVRAAQRARHWETTLGVRVLDSVAAVIAGMLDAVDLKGGEKMVERWGSIFE